MSQTVSITEARNNFPTLVRQVAEQNESVVVTSRNRPQVVLVRWETYQQQQALQAEGAEQRLLSLVDEQLVLLATLQEAYQSGSYAIIQGTQELVEISKQTWKICRLLDKPRRHLASIITDGLLSTAQSDGHITEDQISQLRQYMPLLLEKNLTNELVADADRNLVAAGLDAMVSMGDELVGLYDKANTCRKSIRGVASSIGSGTCPHGRAS